MTHGVKRLLPAIAITALIISFAVLIIFKPTAISCLQLISALINCKTCGAGLINMFYYLLLSLPALGVFIVVLHKKILRLLGKINTAGLTATLVIILLVVLFIACFTRVYTYDEIYHTHPAWMVSKGMVPLVDFYQFHFPLYHLLAAAVIKTTGENLVALSALRLLAYANFLIIVWGTYKIFGLLFSNRAKPGSISPAQRATLFFLLVLLSLPTFTSVIIDIRPDVFMLSSFVLSVYYAMKYLYLDRKIASLWIAGIFGGISILFIQKAVFLLAPMAIFLYHGLGKKGLVALMRCSVVYFTPVLAGLLAYASYYFIIGRFDYFIFFFFKINVIYNAAVNPFKNNLLFFMSNPVFWIVSGALLIKAAVSKFIGLLRESRDNGKQAAPRWKRTWAGIAFPPAKSPRQFFSSRLAVFLVVYVAFFIFFLKRPYLQYLMGHFWIIAILMGIALFDIHARLGKAQKPLFHILLLLLVLGSIPYYAKELAVSNQVQKELYQYVLDNTNATDTVLDGNTHAMLNLFRNDSDPYHWSVPVMQLSNEYLFHLPEYNKTQTILERAPKIIYYDGQLPKELCVYMPTPYKEAYIRSSRAPQDCST